LGCTDYALLTDRHGDLGGIAATGKLVVLIDGRDTYTQLSCCCALIVTSAAQTGLTTNTKKMAIVCLKAHGKYGLIKYIMEHSKKSTCIRVMTNA